MTAIPNPYLTIVVARQRRDEIHAQADHDRLARRAALAGTGRQAGADWHVIALVVVALVLLLAARATTVIDLASHARLDPGSAAGRVASQVLEACVLDPSAARAICAARF